MMRFLIHSVVIYIAAVSGLLSGCSWDSADTPSVLVIAVESLPVESVPCLDLENSSNEQSGFRALCSESVRFTHAYTPSVLSQASLTSVLTGLWPHEHRVVHNGPVHLNARYRTSAEAAVTRGYRTSFFSGGPPIWKKSGLDQGFEVFEDNILISQVRYHRSFRENSDLFLNWLDRESSRTPFFSVIYASDLQYFDIPNIDSEGRPIDRSLLGRLNELDRRLGILFQELKARNRWNETYIVVVGLNGATLGGRPLEIDGFNLLSENSQVALLIKPAQKKRDHGIQWKIDQNISLVDLGLTLFDLVGETHKAPKPGLGSISLKPVLVSPEATWDEDRLIPIQSAWSLWHGVGPIRIALRKGRFLFIDEHPPKLFNTLTDRLESSPLAVVDSSWVNLVRSIFPSSKTSWRPPEGGALAKIRIANELWRESEFDVWKTTSERILNNSKVDPQSASWLALLAVESSRWNELLKIGKKIHNPYWIFLAEQRLKMRSPVPSGGCFAIFKTRPEGSLDQRMKECDDPLFRELVRWKRLEKGSDNIAEHRDQVVKLYVQRLIDRKIGKLNYVNGLVWDVSVREPSPLSEGEVLLLLPENQKYLNEVQERL